MNHPLATALLSALCCVLPGPTVAHGLDEDRASFEDLVRDVVETRVSFERPRDATDMAWPHSRGSLERVLDPRPDWQRFDRGQTNIDDWRESIVGWGGRWQRSDDFRGWPAWQHSPPPAVPEPAGPALLAAGLVVLVAVRRLRRAEARPSRH